MKSNFCVYCLLLFVVCTMIVGCNTVKLRVECPQIPKDVGYSYSVNGHSTFWTLTNQSIQKEVKTKEVFSAVKERSKQFKVSAGTDFIGKRYNHSVTYHITYWDSFLSVISFGIYVPFSIEYEPASQE